MQYFILTNLLYIYLGSNSSIGKIYKSFCFLQFIQKRKKNLKQFLKHYNRLFLYLKRGKGGKGANMNYFGFRSLINLDQKTKHSFCFFSSTSILNRCSIYEYIYIPMYKIEKTGKVKKHFFITLHKSQHPYTYRQIYS